MGAQRRSRTLARRRAPIEDALAAELDLPGPLGGLARRAAGAAIGLEAGLAAGYAAKRVLGQYDVALFGPSGPARLLFVGENLEAARRTLDADRELFLRWVALHESHARDPVRARRLARRHICARSPRG